RPVQSRAPRVSSAPARRGQATEGRPHCRHAQAADDPQRDDGPPAALDADHDLIFNTVALPASGERGKNDADSPDPPFRTASQGCCLGSAFSAPLSQIRPPEILTPSPRLRGEG